MVKSSAYLPLATCHFHRTIAVSDPYAEDVISRAVAGDRDMVSALLATAGPRLQDQLHGQIAPRWQSVLDVDDVLQVTYLEIFLRIARFEYRGPGSFEAWVARIARNNLLDAIKALERAKQLPPAKRVQFQTDEDSSLALLEVLGVTSETPSRQAVAQETHAIVRQAVASLPRDYSQVLSLYDLQGGTAEEVAQEMNRSTGAVYMLRARALDPLREILGTDSQFFST
jgi:RNA polymerase sigma factor (sigma-70 family)